jgi:hypothetical protein
MHRGGVLIVSSKRTPNSVRLFLMFNKSNTTVRTATMIISKVCEVLSISVGINCSNLGYYNNEILRPRSRNTANSIHQHLVQSERQDDRNHWSSARG